MPAPGQWGIKLNPYRAHFITKEQKTQVHLWDIAWTGPFKKAHGNNPWQGHSWEKLQAFKGWSTE